MDIKLYQHCGSYLLGPCHASTPVLHMQGVLDMPLSMYATLTDYQIWIIMTDFIGQAEACIVDGLLLEVDGRKPRIERLEDMWDVATAYDRSHGYPHSLWYEYVPEWHKENMPEMPVRS